VVRLVTGEETASARAFPTVLTTIDGTVTLDEGQDVAIEHKTAIE